MKQTEQMGFGKAVLAVTAFAVLVAIAFGFVFPSKDEMSTAFHNWGFTFIFVTFLLWLLTIPGPVPTWEQVVAFGRRHGFVLMVAVVLVASMFLASPPRFRILADETNLLGMASSMYDHHGFQNPTEQLFYFDGVCDTLATQWDKRTLFFPFMIYLGHVFLGYSANNVFVVNALAGVAALFLLYLLLHQWFSRFISACGMVMLAVYPVVVMWVTSGGFEIPNLAFALLAFLLLDDFLREPTARKGEFLVLTLLLLAQIRYESALFVLILLPVVAWGMPVAEWHHLSWRAPVLPLLFLPIPWQRLTSFNQDLFQMEAGKPAFHIMWLWQNLENARSFFSGGQAKYGTVPLIWWLALVGLVVVVWRLARHWQETTTATRVVAGTAAVTLVFQGAVLFNYFWGNLTLQYAQRLGIIFLPFIVVLAVFVIDWVTEGGRCRRKYVVVPLLGLLCFHWSVAGKNEAAREIFFYREFRLVSEWLRDHLPRQDAIVVSDLSNLYTPFRYSAVSFGTINACPEAWVERVKRHLFQSLLTVQKIRYSDGQPSIGTFLSDRFQAEKLFETQLNAEEFLRISRVVSLRPLVPPASAAAEVTPPVASPSGSVTVQATATLVLPVASGTPGQ